MAGYKLHPLIIKTLIVLFRLALMFAVLELGLAIGGYGRLLYQHHMNNVSSSEGDYYRILILGDSITYGDGASWSTQLEGILNSKSPETKFKVIIEAHAGEGSMHILSQLEGYLNEYDPNMVISMMGMGDSPSFATSGKSSVALTSLRSYKFGSYLLSSFKDTVKEEYGKDISLMTNKNEKIRLNSYVEMLQNNPGNETFIRLDAKLRKIIDDDPTNAGMHNDAEMELQRLYIFWFGPKDALTLWDKYYKERLELEATVGDMLVDYTSHNRANDGEQLLDAVLKLSPSKLVNTLKDFGKNRAVNAEEAQKYFEMAEKIRKEHPNPITSYNYLEMFQILDKRHVRLIAVQYPTLSLDGLKDIFNGDEDIIFVSNEENFRKELENAKYEEIFADRGFTTFGHLTLRGADLIAQNVANAVLGDLGITAGGSPA